MKQVLFIALVPLVWAERDYLFRADLVAIGDSAPYGNPKGHCYFDMETSEVKNCTCPTGEIPLTYKNTQICGKSPCTGDSDCPQPPEGVTARPECVLAARNPFCELVCKNNEECGSAICLDGTCGFVQ